MDTSISEQQQQLNNQHLFQMCSQYIEISERAQVSKKALKDFNAQLSSLQEQLLPHLEKNDCANVVIDPTRRITVKESAPTASVNKILLDIVRETVGEDEYNLLLARARHEALQVTGKRKRTILAQKMDWQSL